MLSKLLAEICSDDIKVEDRAIVLDIYSTASQMPNLKERISYVYRQMKNLRQTHLIELLAVLTPFIFDVMDINDKTGQLRYREIDIVVANAVKVLDPAFMNQIASRMEEIDLSEEVINKKIKEDEDEEY